MKTLKFIATASLSLFLLAACSTNDKMESDKMDDKTEMMDDKKTDTMKSEEKMDDKDDMMEDKKEETMSSSSEMMDDKDDKMDEEDK